MNQVATLPNSVQTHDGLGLHVHHWPVPQAKGVVQLVHGMCEHLGRFDALAKAINEAGWAVAGVDHRGHGRSQGPRGVIGHADDLLRDQALVHDALGLSYRRMPHVMLGYSMGGVIAARFGAALAQPLTSAPWVRPLDGLILAAPALEPTVSAPQRATLSVLARLVPDLSLPLANKLDWASSEPEVVAAMAADPLMHFNLTPRVSQFMMGSGRVVFDRAAGWSVPTLLLYAQDDRLISAKSCERFQALVPADRMEVHGYAHTGHNLFHESGRVQAFRHIAQWLGKVR